MAREITDIRIEQRGAGLLIFVVGLLLLSSVIFALRLITPAQRGSIEATRTSESFEKIQDAIRAYVAINRRLPCPASPNSLNGLAEPSSGTTSCSVPAGIVPWGTLGLDSNAALDGWNRLIAYRVLDGTNGLTQVDGASMVNCDSLYPYGAPKSLGANGLCASDHTNTSTQFLMGKGLVLKDNGTTVSGVAYVLISHGPTGYGAYLPGGNSMPAPVSAAEIANRGLSNFVKAPHSDPLLAPSDIAHFDDSIVWVTISDLMKQSGLDARDWQDTGKKVEITSSTTANMTTAGADHFNATVAAGGETFTAIDAVSDSAHEMDTLVFGGGGAYYASCLWWPTSFRLYDGSNRYSLRLYFEFSTASSTVANDFGGFVAGFLSKEAVTSSGISLTGLCGDSNTSRDIGWGNGVSSDGKLPSPRFGVEYDAYQHSFIYHDPSSNHLAIVFNDVRHTGAPSAATCSSTSDSYSAGGDCYTGPSDQWLRSGLTKFHRARIEVVPRDPACSSGTAPSIKVWILPVDVCSSGSNDLLCASASDVATTFAPVAPLPTGVVAVSSCVPATIPTSQLDDLYFGFTAANRPSATTPTLNLRNIGVGAYLIQ